MKIGILTFHKVNNVGAVLQAFALCKYINRNFCDAEIIDYTPQNMIPRKKTVLYRFLRCGKRMLTPHISIREIVVDKKFEKFRNDFYSMSEKTYYGDEEIRDNVPRYDIYISGSDQVLNITLTGTSRAYYLDFVNDAIKISYASSFGREDITDIEKMLIREALPQFTALSFREKSASELVKQILGVSSTVVIDPVFLMNKSEWTKIIGNQRLIKNKYIFVYSMENTDLLKQTVSLVKNHYNYPVVVVYGGLKVGKIAGKKKAFTGPTEWLNYLYNAEIVITNSFHGTAFSLLFEKQFCTVKHSTRNARLEHLFDIIDNRKALINKHLDNKNILHYLVDGKKFYKAIEPVIKKSKEYLKKYTQNGEK